MIAALGHALTRRCGQAFSSSGLAGFSLASTTASTTAPPAWAKATIGRRLQPFIQVADFTPLAGDWIPLLTE